MYVADCTAGLTGLACAQHTISVAMPIPIVRVRHARGVGPIVRIRARFLYPFSYPFLLSSFTPLARVASTDGYSRHIAS